MKARAPGGGGCAAMVDLLRQQGYEVIAPFSRARARHLLRHGHRREPRPDSGAPAQPVLPAQALRPAAHRAAAEGSAERGSWQIEPTYEDHKRAIFGIRSCDVAGIWHLDRFYLGREFRDVYYEKRRQNLFLVNVVCTDPERDISEECFCVCADTGPAARDHFDLQLMDLGGEFWRWRERPRARRCFRTPCSSKATAAHVEKRRAILGDVRKRFKTTTSWFPATVRYVSQGTIWRRPGRRSATAAWSAAAAPTSVRRAPVSP
jgi:hypothetical protein